MCNTKPTGCEPYTPSSHRLHHRRTNHDAQACKKRMRQRATQHKREKSNSEEKAPLKTQPSGCLLQALTNTEDARLRALACSSQPAAVSNVESSTAASAPTALCDDAQACKKRIRQRATQHKREKIKQRGKSTIESTAKRLP